MPGWVKLACRVWSVIHREELKASLPHTSPSIGEKNGRFKLYIFISLFSAVKFKWRYTVQSLWNSLIWTLTSSTSECSRRNVLQSIVGEMCYRVIAEEMCSNVLFSVRVCCIDTITDFLELTKKVQRALQ